MSMQEPKVVEVRMTIANVNEALEHWFNTVVFRIGGVEIEDVSFSEREHFKIRFKCSADNQ